MQKPQFWQYEKKYLATAMVLFEYCAAFKILMREKTAQQFDSSSVEGSVLVVVTTIT